MNRVKTLLMTLLVTNAGVIGGARPALAQGGIPACASLPKPVFMGGTTAVIPVIRLLGARLKQIGVTLLWNENSEGCASVSQLVSPRSNLQRTVFTQYDEEPSQPGKVRMSNCNGTIDQVPDLVINDVSFAACSTGTTPTGEPTQLPAGFKEFQGPVQGLVPIVASSYTYYNDITTEELQNLYVCGAAGNILTFLNNPNIYDYNCTASGMRELWARGLGLKTAKALTTQIGPGCSNTITAETMVTNSVSPSAKPDETLGYTSTEFYDQYRDLVRALKVRGLNQNLAYWPDSDMTSTDKINIREGRYVLQGTLRLVAAADANGVPTNSGAKHLIDWFQQNPIQDVALQLPFDVNEIYAQRGVVPQCAMKVTRDGDSPVFKRYRAPQPCHCSFQILATGKSTIPGCVPCAGVSAGTCQAGQVCSHGYCEQVN